MVRAGLGVGAAMRAGRCELGLGLGAARLCELRAARVRNFRPQSWGNFAFAQVVRFATKNRGRFFRLGLESSARQRGCGGFVN